MKREGLNGNVSGFFSVGEAAEKLGVPDRKIRLGIDCGWITPRIDASGSTLISPAELEWVGFGITARELGFSIVEIDGVLAGRQSKDIAFVKSAVLQRCIDRLTNRREMIDAKIIALKGMLPVVH